MALKLFYPSSILFPSQDLLEAVDEVISPVHLFSHFELCHVYFCINVLQTVLKVLWQTVDCTVCQRCIIWIQWCKTHIL